MTAHPKSRQLHRAPGRPRTIFTGLGLPVSTGIVIISSVVGASGAAVAVPVLVPQDQGVDETPLDAVLTDSQVVTIPSDAEWSIEAADVRAARPRPRPAPAPVAVSSRTSPRAVPSAAPAASQPAAPQNFSSSAVIEIAYRYLGVPYVWGGSTPAGFDCSGFTQYVFRQVGIELPRTSAAQRYAGRVVSASEARPGDLIWWPGHVGIYLGGDQHIAARQPGTSLTAGPIYRSNPTFIRVG